MIDPKIVAEMVSMYEQGADVKAIAEEFGRAPSTVYALLRDQGIALRKDLGPSGFLDPELVETVLRDYAKGVPVTQIMAVTDLTQHTVYRILEEHGVETRRMAARKQKKTIAMAVNEAIQMYEDGAKLVAIQAQTGVYPQQLYAEMYKRAIPLRRDLHWPQGEEHEGV